MLRLVNVTEMMVFETIDDVLKSFKEICSCERCKLDMAALALNRLSPSYVVTSQGEVLLRASSLKQQLRVDLLRAVTEAVGIVGKKPHHSREND
ncbi:MAG: Late competence development protein ComFB [Pelotomaculum sp. PtaU1.Bin035]|nr:MAG: Late competence development protein ComFB [Pelotomaculum sp. PtaU1.Bin035]